MQKNVETLKCVKKRDLRDKAAVAEEMQFSAANRLIVHEDEAMLESENL